MLTFKARPERHGHPTTAPSLKDRKRARRANTRAAMAIAHQPALSAPDWPLVWVTIFLGIFGLMAVYTASAHMGLREMGNSATFVIKQTVALGLGALACWGASQIHYGWWRRMASPIAFASIALLVLTLAIGKTANGSERWLPLPFGLQFQPLELAKLATVMLIASRVWYGRQGKSGQRRKLRLLGGMPTWVNLGLIGVMIVLVLKQPNLSGTMLLGLVSGVMLFVAGLPAWLFAGGIPVVSMLLVQKIRETPYQWRRIVGWLDPWQDPLDTGYNLIQSYYAIGSGGIWGAGLGRSVQKLYYLPFQHTDFIFSVICEELGLLGAAMVVGAFGILAWRGFGIAMRAEVPFAKMLALGITTLLIGQALLNIAVTVGMLPVTGVTLPLVSYGGTSVVITMFAIGILLNISRQQQQQTSLLAIA